MLCYLLHFLTSKIDDTVYTKETKEKQTNSFIRFFNLTGLPDEYDRNILVSVFTTYLFSYFTSTYNFCCSSQTGFTNGVSVQMKLGRTFSKTLIRGFVFLWLINTTNLYRSNHQIFI